MRDKIRPSSRGSIQERISKIAAAIAAEREAQGLSRADVARAAGTTRESMGNAERGRAAPSLPMFLAICDGLGIAPAELLELAGEGVGVSPSEQLGCPKGGE